MATIDSPQNTDHRLEVERDIDTGAGFVMLSLGQVILLFTCWITIWPSAFGVPETGVLVPAIGVGFGVASLVGFYFGFRALMVPAEE